ncbi:hypothetical protein Y1Q_0021061 [Alligator mississippiensis]|uniref:Uncharacterized protein n=1 Tax=Alligator mississippiensis TaxID=8496 RepID=A0A151NSG2_ALLMI|nr:hypothetical protein Y1Q_0021061 [Alligator mississippiensis]
MLVVLARGGWVDLSELGAEMQDVVPVFTAFTCHLGVESWVLKDFSVPPGVHTLPIYGCSIRLSITVQHFRHFQGH